MPKELWYWIPGYKFYYMASNQGRIKNKFGHIMKPNPVGKQKYLYVGLSKFGNKRDFRLHRLIALTFIPNPENKPWVNHKNGDIWDNAVSNLEWSTVRENVIHAIKNGMIKIGEDRTQAKLKNKDIISIIKMTGPTDIIGERFGVCGQLIRDIKRGKKWSRISGIEYKPARRLTPEEVLAIFNDNREHKLIAASYGLGVSNISGIKTGKIWGQVTGKKYLPKSIFS